MSCRWNSNPSRKIVRSDRNSLMLRHGCNSAAKHFYFDFFRLLRFVFVLFLTRRKKAAWSFSFIPLRMLDSLDFCVFRLLSSACRYLSALNLPRLLNFRTRSGCCFVASIKASHPTSNHSSGERLSKGNAHLRTQGGIDRPFDAVEELSPPLTLALFLRCNMA